MYKKIHTLVLLFICQALSMPLWAQDSTKPVEMADKFRADGKIYVVVAVVIIILLGLIWYVARLDRKISRLEQK
jgi:ABC-type amino acid transport system permease subunit